MVKPIERAPTFADMLRQREAASTQSAAEAADMEVEISLVADPGHNATPMEGVCTAGEVKGLKRSHSSMNLLTGAEAEPETSPLKLKPFLSPRDRPSTATTAAESSHKFGSVRRQLMGSRESEAIRALFRESVEPQPPRLGLGSHYLVVSPRFDLFVDGEYRVPEVYQPTPEGLDLLVRAHQRHNEVDLRVHEKGAQTEDRFADRVIEFMESADLNALGENHPIGVILSHGQMHAIPVFLAVQGAQKYMLVLDSTAGSIHRQYWAVARRFPEYQVRLNFGTRQADNQSCITDAFEILKQCYTLGKLVQLVEDRRLAEPPPAQTNSRLFIQRESCPKNFSLFNLPEELAFVVQRASYQKVSGLDMNKLVTVEGRTCALSTHVVISTEFGRKHSSEAVDVERIRANIYLYQASRRHRDIIESELAGQGARQARA